MRPEAYHFRFHHLGTWQWIFDNRGYIGSLSATHLYLALSSVAIGLIVAIPLGVAAAQLRRVYGPILAVTTIVYALPSLAVFAFLVSVTGLSNLTVILPLAAYAVTILVRSVTDGLRSVSDEIRVAATAMGYGPFRRLVTVELPAAVPVVVAGLRLATVSSISLVTVGALIGIGGLGELFTAGENNNFPTEIIVGVIAVGFWALLFDALLVAAGRLLAPWARAQTRSPS